MFSLNSFFTFAPDFLFLLLVRWLATPLFIYIKEWGTKKLIRSFRVVYPPPTTGWSEGKQYFFFLPLGGLQCIKIYSHSVPPMKMFQSAPWINYLAAWTLKPRERKIAWVPCSPHRPLFHPCLLLSHPSTMNLSLFP